MKTKQRLASFIIIAMLLSLFTAITIIAIPDKPVKFDGFLFKIHLLSAFVFVYLPDVSENLFIPLLFF